MDEFLSIGLDDICIKNLKKINSDKPVKKVKLERVVHDVGYIFIYNCESTVKIEGENFLADYILHIKATPDDIKVYKNSPHKYNEALTKNINKAITEYGWVHPKLVYNIYKLEAYK